MSLASHRENLRRNHALDSIWALVLVTCVACARERSGPPEVRYAIEGGAETSPDTDPSSTASSGPGEPDAALEVQGADAASPQTPPVGPGGSENSETTGDESDHSSAPEPPEEDPDVDDHGTNGGTDDQATASDLDAGLESSPPSEPGADPEREGGATDVPPSVFDASALRQGMVLLLPMEEVEWSGAEGEVQDYSGRGNHGTIQGQPSVVPSGKFGSAGSFNQRHSTAISDWIEIADHTTLRPNDKLTLAAWIYPTEVGIKEAYGIIAKRYGYDSNTSYTLYLGENSRLTCDIQDEDDRFSSTRTFAAGAWYHVAVVYDGALPTAQRVRMYVDGQLDREAPESAERVDPEYGAPVVVGYLVSGGDTFTGLLDDVTIWKRALSAQEIRALAEATQSLAEGLSP